MLAARTAPATTGQVPGDKGALPRTERLNTVERSGRLARDHEVDFVVVTAPTSKATMSTRRHAL